MDLHQLCISLKERHENGTSYKKLADEFGVSKPVIWRIIKGKHPGPKVRAVLHLDPSPALQRTRARRQRLNEQARAWGYSSWYAYEEIMQFWQVP